ncbi:MAG: PRC-barrel domain-containing protein, partial [Candidatus Dormibacteraeota bacterium]|nr:PRC-barrel domain-containing protein [Candidatus Dormibacteraeota bacterium]
MPAAAGRGPRPHRGPAGGGRRHGGQHAAVRTFRTGEEVLDREGRRLGSVERLVVDEGAHRVTHLVV